METMNIEHPTRAGRVDDKPAAWDAVVALALSAFALMAGVAGTSLIGPVPKGGLYRVLVAIPVLMAAIASLLIRFGSSLTFTSILLGRWGLVATAAPVGWWTWLARTLPRDAEAGGGLINVVLTPHVGSFTIETRTAMGMLAANHLLAHVDGKSLLTPVSHPGN